MGDPMFVLSGFIYLQNLLLVAISIKLSILAVEQIRTTLLPLWFAAGMLSF